MTGPVAVGKVVLIGEAADKSNTEVAYHPLSRDLLPKRFNEVMRQHRITEYGRHWRLDSLGDGIERGKHADVTSARQSRDAALHVHPCLANEGSIGHHAESSNEKTGTMTTCYACWTISQMRLRWLTVAQD